MTTEQAAASFNPDDASGLLDDARVRIQSARVGTFTAKTGKNAGATYVNLDVVFDSGNGQQTTEHYMIGDNTQWAPNAAKTGVIAVGREGGKLWNKSDAIKFSKSVIDAGFPKGLIANDMSVLDGLDVHVKRVTDAGGRVYQDKEGKERAASTLLVTKIYTPESERGKTGGATTAAAPAKKQSVAKAASAAAATAPAANTEEVDTVATDTLLAILATGPVSVDAVEQPAFLALTKARKGSIRPQVIARMKDAAFLGGLADAGLVTFDGGTIAAAA